MSARIGWVVGLALVAAAPLQGQAEWRMGDPSWCDGREGRSDALACEVRTTTFASTGSLDVDGHMNGGIQVTSWEGDAVQVEARIEARARTDARARELMRDIGLRASAGSLRVDGPDTDRRESWSVSYRIRVPRTTDLSLRTMNGGISVAGVTGDADLRTTNGGVRLTDLAGDVRARTTNGGLTVQLAGERWSGAGLDAQTTNGGVTVAVPDGYSADLHVATTNGGVRTDFPLTVQGRIGRELRATLGSGGSPIRAVTTNGSVRVERR